MRRALFAAALLVGLGASAGVHAQDRPASMVVLGIDGLDPVLLREMIDAGAAPNFAALAEQGGFMPLGTSVPPQSPVAWSDFITGADSGYHGIFDFIALERDTLVPRQSTSKQKPASREPLHIGKWRIPLDGDEILQARDGVAFWELLEARGIPARLFRIPANYPPVDAGETVSGMGTPDLRGSSGIFSLFTDDPDWRDGPVSGGEIHRVRVRRGTMRTELEGPPNAFVAGTPQATVPMVVHVDPENPVAEIRIGDERVLLREGDWSEWVPVRFELVPALSALGATNVSGMARFYLKSTRPYLALYASPINIDPRDPAQPIAHPMEYARELAEAAGPFYTQEMPEDTKALSAHVLSPEEFLSQSELVLGERQRLLHHELDRFERQGARGLLFFYVSSVDQRSHMLWRQMDTAHPFHDADTPEAMREAIRKTYTEIDAMLGFVRKRLGPDTALVVMSDHGFSPFRRQANLNTWLEQNGYLALANPEQRDSVEWLEGLDWSRTKAFAIGLNSLYLNVRGREKFGSVEPAERAALAREIADKLRTWTDPETGERVVTQPLLREEAYHGPHVDEAPDILVGYGRSFRASWGTTSAQVPAGLLEDNDREWSGDHCMDARVVPGVLLSSVPLSGRPGTLRDLTVSILAHFGIEPPAHMTGQNLFAAGILRSEQTTVATRREDDVR